MCEIARLIVFPPEVPVTGKEGDILPTFR